MRNRIAFAAARLCVVAAVASLLSPSLSSAQQAAWKPNRVVEMVVPTSTGGGTDETARIIQAILHGRDGLEMVVTNRGGAGGGIAYAYMNRNEGNGHFLSMSTLNLVTNAPTGGHPLTQADVTAIAHLFSEYPVFVVRSESPIASGVEMIRRLKADPESMTFAFSPGLGGALHLATGVTAKAAGVEPKRLRVVAYQSAGAVITAVIGGHIDVGVMNPPVAIAQAQGGRVRIVAIASPQRFGGALANVPTWKEQGVNAVSASWRGVIGPKGLSDAQVRYWETVIEQMTKTDAWKKHLEQNMRDNEFMGARKTRDYYVQQAEELKALVNDLGLAK